MKNLLYIAIALLALVGCKPSEPSDVMSADDMADVLYDMQKAQALQNYAPENVHADYTSLRASVLKKYDLTEEEWARSYDYYCNNAEKLYGIYKTVGERMDADVVALGGKVEGIEGSESDTANVWHSEPNMVLMTQAPYNRFAFEIQPDSTFHDGDRITLQYDVQTLYQDGMKDIVAHLDLYYANDSVVSRTNHNSFDGSAVLTINNDEARLHVTKIRGYFLIASSLSENKFADGFAPLRIAVLRNIKLLHLPTMLPAPPTPKDEAAPADSTKKDSVAVEP